MVFVKKCEVAAKRFLTASYTSLAVQEIALFFEEDISSRHAVL